MVSRTRAKQACYCAPTLSCPQTGFVSCCCAVLPQRVAHVSLQIVSTHFALQEVRSSRVLPGWKFNLHRNHPVESGIAQAPKDCMGLGHCMLGGPKECGSFSQVSESFAQGEIPGHLSLDGTCRTGSCQQPLFTLRGVLSPILHGCSEAGTACSAGRTARVPTRGCCSVPPHECSACSVAAAV